MPDPNARYASLVDHIKPGSARQIPAGGPEDAPWEPPSFERYEDIRQWLTDSVMSANLYERYPDGRWTIELLLKEQNPGTPRFIVL